MTRCFDLARLGAGKVAPNPMVGAVLVHDDRIIGEGYHREFGQAHAEVNAVASVPAHDRQLIPHSTLYVSLEPCCFFGKTPPCTNLILDQQIPRVVISCLDQTPQVAGKSVRLLRQAGVEVAVGILEQEGKRLVAPRNVFATQQRPYILLKYALSADGFIAPAQAVQQWLTHPVSRRLVHKWRSEYQGIMVGTETARIDDPRLDNRLYFGKPPLRIVLDRRLRLPHHLKVFDGSVSTLLVCSKEPPRSHPCYHHHLLLPPGIEELPYLFTELGARNLGSVMVEGGGRLLQSLIEAGLWDEARIFISSTFLGSGRPAPVLGTIPEQVVSVASDRLLVHYRSR